jgi:hypothetical protein
MYDNDGASGAVIRFVSAGGVEAVDALMNTYKDRPRVLEDALVCAHSAFDLLALVMWMGALQNDRDKIGLLRSTLSLLLLRCIVF